MKVQILWDASTNVEAYKLLDTEGYYDFSLWRSTKHAGSGKQVTYVYNCGHANTETYNIILDMTTLKRCSVWNISITYE